MQEVTKKYAAWEKALQIVTAENQLKIFMKHESKFMIKKLRERLKILKKNTEHYNDKEFETTLNKAREHIKVKKQREGIIQDKTGLPYLLHILMNATCESESPDTIEDIQELQKKIEEFFKKPENQEIGSAILYLLNDINSDIETLNLPTLPEEPKIFD